MSVQRGWASIPKSYWWLPQLLSGVFFISIKGDTQSCHFLGAVSKIHPLELWTPPVEANLELRYDLSASLTADPNHSWAHRGTKAVSSPVLSPRKQLIKQQPLKASSGHRMFSPALFYKGAVGFLGNHRLLLESSPFASNWEFLALSCAKVLVEGSKVPNTHEWLCWVDTCIKQRFIVFEGHQKKEYLFRRVRKSMWLGNKQHGWGISPDKILIHFELGEKQLLKTLPGTGIKN